MRYKDEEDWKRQNAGCWNCANMKHNECIYDMESELEEDQEYCDCYERR